MRIKRSMITFIQKFYLLNIFWTGVPQKPLLAWRILNRKQCSHIFLCFNDSINQEFSNHEMFLIFVFINMCSIFKNSKAWNYKFSYQTLPLFISIYLYHISYNYLSYLHRFKKLKSLKLEIFLSDTAAAVPPTPESDPAASFLAAEQVGESKCGEI